MSYGSCVVLKRKRALYSSLPFAAGEDHGLVLLANLEAELLGRRRRGLGVLGEPYLNVTLLSLPALNSARVESERVGCIDFRDLVDNTS